MSLNKEDMVLLTQNPLDGAPEDHFPLTMMNPNPTAGKNKGGAWYRLSVELSQEEWQHFQDAELKGMVLECMCSVTHANTPERDPDTVDLVSGETDRESKRGGPLSQRSDALARDPEFQQFLSEEYLKDAVKNVDDAREFIRSYCNVESRAELDHNHGAAECFKRMLSLFTRWGNE